MAVFLGDLVLISLGVSCQTAFQLEDQKALLEEISGETAEYRNTPFDWLLCPPASAGAILDDDVFFPAEDAELALLETPYWRRHRVHYLHEPTILNDPSKVRAKFAHTAQTLRRARQAKRRVLLISNSQRNVADYDARISSEWYRFTPENMATLRDSVERFFGPSKLYAISERGRHDLAAQPWVFEVTPPAYKPWKAPLRGQPDQWAAIFKAILPTAAQDEFGTV